MCRPTRTYGRHILLARHLRNVSVDTPSIRATCVAVISSGTSMPERMRPGTVLSGNDHTGPAFPGMAGVKVERTTTKEEPMMPCIGDRAFKGRGGHPHWIGNGVLDRFLEDESLFGEFLRTPVSEGGVEPLVVEPPHVVVEVGA